MSNGDGGCCESGGRSLRIAVPLAQIVYQFFRVGPVLLVPSPPVRESGERADGTVGEGGGKG